MDHCFDEFIYLRHWHVLQLAILQLPNLAQEGSTKPRRAELAEISSGPSETAHLCEKAQTNKN